MVMFDGIMNSVSSFLGGPSSTGGDLLSAGASIIGGSLGNASSAASIKKQMEFQERMSNTSYQRAVKDMEAAGLNPMLAYSQGGASVPSGSSYVAQDVVTPALHSAQQARQTSADVSLKKQQVASVAASTMATAEQAKLNSALTAKAQAETAAIHQTVAGRTPITEMKDEGWKALKDMMQEFLRRQPIPVNSAKAYDSHASGASKTYSYFTNPLDFTVQSAKDYFRNFGKTSSSAKSMSFPEGTLLPPPTYRK